MKPARSRPGGSRLIWVIAAKDIADALKNRTILAIVVGVLLLMLTGPALSLLLNRDRPTLVVYGPGSEAFLPGLIARDDLLVVPVDSQEELESYLLQPGQTILGVVLPLDPHADPAAGLVLEGYTAHWARPSEVRERVAFFESALGEIGARTVRIDVAGHLVYPVEADIFQFTMIAMSLMTMVLVMGLALVPYLFIEEKESHTLEALLVSPASYGQLVVGKMIAGAVYGLLAAAIVLGLNFRVFVHWDLILAAVLLGTAFTVALGLLLGMLVDNAGTLGLWSGLFSIVLLFPPLLETVGTSKVPAWLVDLLAWLPSTALYRLIVQSMLGEVRAAVPWQDIPLLAGATLAVALLVVWRVRRMDR